MQLNLVGFRVPAVHPHPKMFRVHPGIVTVKWIIAVQANFLFIYFLLENTEDVDMASEDVTHKNLGKKALKKINKKKNLKRLKNKKKKQQKIFKW